MTIARCLFIAVFIFALMSGVAPSAAWEWPSPLGRYARGWTQAVATVDGSEFYFGNGSALMIRHADESLTEIETGAMVLGLEVADDYVYVVGDGGLRIIDLLAPGGPAVVGRCRMPGVAESVVVLDGRAYVAGGKWGMRVVDITAPTEPIVMGTIDTPGWAADLAVDRVGASTIAVVADTDPGLSVIDATVPDGLVPLAEVDPGLGGVFAVENTGGHAYAANHWGNALSIVDISTPAQPELVGEWYKTGGDIGVPTAGLAVVGGYAYVAGKLLVIVDVSDPAQANEVARVGLVGGGRDVAAAQGQVAVATGEAIHFFDASNPHVPIEQEIWPAHEHRTEASVITRTQDHVIGFGGSFSFIENGLPGTPDSFFAVAGLHIFDVGDSDRPRLVGEGLPDHPIWDAEGVDNHVFAVTGDGRFRVVDVSDPTQPSQVGALSGLVTSEALDQEGVDIEVLGNLAVVAGDLGLIIIDITEPTNPFRLGDLPNPCFGVELSGDRAYVADHHGIFLVDLEVPSVPVVVDDGLHYLDFSPTDFEVAGGYAYLIGDVDELVTLRVMDLETDDRWTLVGELELVDSEHHSYRRPRNGVLSVAGDRLALALSDWNNPYSDMLAIGALAIIEISDPTRPMEVVEAVTPAETRSVMIDRGMVYVGDGRGGLAVYRNALFADGFESGDTGSWSAASP